jgi:hypothetical protein
MPIRGLQEQNDGYPNFEHLEAEGQRLLPEQLKTMLKALARSSLLRGEAAEGLFAFPVDCDCAGSRLGL